MAIYTMTDQALYNEIQYHLLETPNSGASYGSGLFTVAEVVEVTNRRIQDFLARTRLMVSYGTSSSTANTSAQALPTSGYPAEDVLDIVRVAFEDENGDLIAIPKGSVEEIQLTLSDIRGSNAAVDVPSIWTWDDADPDTINMYPPPDTSARDIHFVYVPRPANLPATPDGTVVMIPDNFIPFVKYGILADLWSKNNETNDPLRVAVCTQLYELGIEAALSILNRRIG